MIDLSAVKKKLNLEKNYCFVYSLIFSLFEYFSFMILDDIDFLFQNSNSSKKWRKSNLFLYISV